MRKETLFIRIPQWLGEWIDFLAFEKDITKTATVIEILEDYYRHCEMEGTTYELSRNS